jgi:hypothetical protein
MAQGVVNRSAIRGLGTTVPVRSALWRHANPGMGYRGCWSCQGVPTLPFWRQDRAWPCPEWLKYGVGPAWEPAPSPEVWHDCKDRARRSPYPSGRARRNPRPRGRASPKGSGEPETFLVGPDRAATTLTIVLDGPRSMSFNSYLLGT